MTSFSSQVIIIKQRLAKCGASADGNQTTFSSRLNPSLQGWQGSIGLVKSLQGIELQAQQAAAANAGRVSHRERLRLERAAARDMAAAVEAAAACKRDQRLLDLAAQVIKIFEINPATE